MQYHICHVIGSSTAVHPISFTLRCERSASLRMASTTSRVWKHIDSSMARTMCPDRTKEVNPTMTPRASSRHLGARRPLRKRHTSVLCDSKQLTSLGHFAIPHNVFRAPRRTRDPSTLSGTKVFPYTPWDLPTCPGVGKSCVLKSTVLLENGKGTLRQYV